MLRRGRRSEDLLSDFRELLAVAMKSVDTVLHCWGELKERERRKLLALGPEVRALAERIDKVAGRLPPRSGEEWEAEEHENVVPLVSGARYDHRDKEAEETPRADAKQWLENLTERLAPMRHAIDVTDLYARVAGVTVTTLASDACIVSTYDPSRRVLRDTAASTPGPAPLNIVVEEYAIDDFPATRRVIEEGVSLEISASDPEADPTERALLVDLGFARVLMCPFSLEDDDATGVIEIYRIADRAFRKDDFRRVQAISSFAASTHARIQLSEQLQENFTKTIEALTSAVEARHAETQAHTRRIRDRALALADVMKLPPEVRRRVHLGAILHDVGKIGVPDAILLKPGPLDPDEFAAMKEHPEIGAKLLSGVDFLQPALPVVRHHHERWDGTGYPDGLSGEDIPIEARIVGLCDAFDAMTSDRPYRPAKSVEAACREIQACSGTHFDPELVTVLLAIIKRIGTEDLDSKLVRYAV